MAAPVVILRRALWGAAIVALAGVAATVWWARTVQKATAEPDLRLRLATVVDLAPGDNRLAFGFTDRDDRVLTGHELTDVSVTVSDPSGREPQPVQTVPARFLPSGWTAVSLASYYENPHPLADGFFTATVRFPRAGQWALEFTARRPGRTPFAQRLLPNVLSESLTPPAGTAAPRTRHPTLKDVGGDLSLLDSDPRLSDVALHRTSIADAIQAGRPTIVLFASPGLDESRLSLPVTEVVSSLYPDYGATVEFIHVEVYDLERYRAKLRAGTGGAAPSDLELAEAAQAWGVQNAPWLFVIDPRGRIVAKFFGPVARSEVEQLLQRVRAEGR